MTEIALRQAADIAPAAETDDWVSVVQHVSKLAGVICDTDFVPKAYRGNAPAATAAILTGRELGLPPMTSLRHVQLVEGSPSLSAEYKRARVLSAGHEFDVLEATTTTCTVSGRRRGSSKPPLVITFTLKDAERAGLLRPSKSGRPGAWQTRPRRMLFARAGTELCDFLFADVTNGLPTAELLAEASAGDTHAGYDEQPAPRGPVTTAEILDRGPASDEGAKGAKQEAAPEDQPGSVSEDQLKRLHTILSGLGFTSDDREAKLVTAEVITGRAPLTGPTRGRSSKNLSYTEAATLIARLDEFTDESGERNRDALIAYMATREGGEAA